MTTDATAECPVHHVSQRRTGFGRDHHLPGIEQEGDVWHLRAYDPVRQVLRDSERVQQGAATESVLVNRLRPSVFFLDGEAHREQRSAIARFFTPKAVQRSYQGFIDAATQRLVDELHRTGRADVSDMSMRLAVDVAAQVVGLTESRRPGMDRRIDGILAGTDVQTSGVRRRRGVGWVLKGLQGVRRMGSFYVHDVRPAIRARRVQPREDVISHLLDRGHNNLEILVECLTYGTAGMITTREFIGVAAWHMLTDPELREQYVAGEQEDRRRVLHEILRLEPVASNLWRRAAKELIVEHGGVTHRIPEGALIVLDLRTANADPEAVGQEPLRLDPQRTLARGVQPPVVSFGDGVHRCPGAFLAIHESDVFLHRLLRLPVQLAREPRLVFNDMLKSYEIRDLEVTLLRG